MPENLPIYEVLEEVKDQLRLHNTVILLAPPGAGKSTILPPELLYEDWLGNNKILMLEPRRLAARSVANRMSSLLHEEPGNTVGFRIRFESKVSSKTRIEVLTEGMLTAKLQQDSTLEGVGLIIFDEFHERSLQADLALALCRDVQQVLREDLRILIMSATLDGKIISSVLGNAPVITSKGRQYPIVFKYTGNDTLTPFPNRISGIIRTALKEEEGDILVFLPGAGEISKVSELLNSLPGHIDICPLYGNLSFTDQQKAIQPAVAGRRKIVVSTSVAETSLTIEGIKIVIDSGLSRIAKFDPRSGLTRLETTKVTLDTADQRAGRAGRLGPGVCYRLWSEGTHYQLQPHRTPEIEEADLASMVLELAYWKIADINSLNWITKPPQGALSQAKELLQKLEALDENFKITPKGKEMVRLPTHPRIAHLLLEGNKSSLIKLACDVAALLEEKDPLFKETSADFGLRTDLLRKWRNKERVSADISALERIERLAVNWRRLFNCEEDNTLETRDKTGFLIAAAYPERIARQKDNDIQRYRLANGKTVKLPSGMDSLDREKWLAVAHLDGGGSEGRIYLAAPLNPDHLSHLVKKREAVAWDYHKGTLLAQTELYLNNIIIKSYPLDDYDIKLKYGVLIEVVRKSGMMLFSLTDGFLNFQARILSLKKWNPNEALPDISNEYLMVTAEEWLLPYLDNVKRKEDFSKINLEHIIKGLFTWQQTQLIDSLAPDAVTVPSGFKVPLQYFADGRDPVLSVRLQEMFGLLETPVINQGKTKVLIHLLSPGYKPVQVTQDLKSFWKHTYQDVRKQLKIKYQKHHWPEDP